MNDKEIKELIDDYEQAVILTECYILNDKSHCHYDLAYNAVLKYKQKINYWRTVMENKTSIIAFGGEKQCGKDTSAEFLINENGYSRISFADPLKEVTASTFNHELAEYHDNNLKDLPYDKPLTITDENLSVLNTNISYLFPVPYSSSKSILDLAGKTVNSHRELLQFVGVEVGRDRIDPEIWTSIFLGKVSKMDKAVITDMRFKNERDLVRLLKGELIRVKRPGVESTDTHSSENSLGEDSEYSSVLMNDGTLTDLKTNLVNILNDKLA